MTFFAGQPLSATDLNMEGVSSGIDVTVRTTTATSYTTTLSPAQIWGVSFIAPPSGKVMIHWTTALSNSVGGNLAQCSPSVRTGAVVGSGSLYSPSGDTYLSSGANIRPGTSALVTGLTPGAVYNAALEHRVTATGTGSFSDREIIVVPQLA